MKFPMFSSSTSTTKVKVKIPSEPTSPTLRCLINGPFRDLHFSVSDHRITPVHDVVFLDEVDNPSVTPLIYRHKPPTSPTETDKFNGNSNGYQYDCDE